MSFEHIPDEMKARPQWVAWSLVQRPGKPTKLPINPKNGQLAKTDDPSTWGTFDQAVRTGKQLSGIGYVFSKDDPYCGIDLDGHIDHDLIKWLGSYAERSQSGNGAHIIVKAQIEDGRKTDRFEIYDRLRYFVMTGDVIHPQPIVEAQDKVDQFIARVFPADEERKVDLSAFLSKPAPVLKQVVLERIRSSSQAAKFEALWGGDWSGYESQSQADAALLSILRFWTGGNKSEAFSLFGRSGLCREKWTRRADYRERTWRSIDSGQVYEEPEPIVISPQIVKRNVSPWRNVTIEKALEAIEGSVLEPLVAALRSPMEPILPGEIGLIKALALCGCALSERRAEPKDGGNLAIHTQRGADLARVRIMTAGGQVSNVLAMIIAPSAIGKDVGGIAERVAHNYGWMIGTSGSEEGIADAYISKPNGLLQISEFSNWLDRRHWQSKAAGFLTHAFNKGWFSHAMSKRADVPARESNYCYPNIYAAIQPGALQAFASRLDLETGFLGRFLIAQAPGDYFGSPVSGDLRSGLSDALRAIDALRAKDCDVLPPQGYNRELARMFIDHNAEPGATWRRLVNEYYPRFAVMLSVRPGDMSPTITVTPDAWRRAGLMVQYFFAQAEGVLTNIHDDQHTNRFEALCARVLAIIRGGGSEGVTLANINSLAGRGTRSSDRKEIIEELQSRGLIVLEKQDRITMLRAI